MSKIYINTIKKNKEKKKEKKKSKKSFFPFIWYKIQNDPGPQAQSPPYYIRWSRPRDMLDLFTRPESKPTNNLPCSKPAQ